MGILNENPTPKGNEFISLEMKKYLASLGGEGFAYDMWDHLLSVAENSKTSFDIFGTPSQDFGLNFNTGDIKLNSAMSMYTKSLMDQAYTKKLNDAERADLLALQIAGGISPGEATRLAAGDQVSGNKRMRFFAPVMGAIRESGGLNIVANRNDIPQTSNSKIEEIKNAITVNSVDDPRTRIDETGQKTYSLYKVTDTKTKQSKFYYVLSTKTKKSVNLERIKNNSTDFLGPDLPPVTPPELLPTIIYKKSKPYKPPGSISVPQIPNIDLFYSPDYKTLYANEQQRLAIILLDTPELVLSNFNYRTIDSIPGVAPKYVSDTNGNYTINGEEEKTQVSATMGMKHAEETYSIWNTTFSSLRSQIRDAIVSNYSNMVLLFGKKNTVKSQKISLSTGANSSGLPTYDKNGIPSYQLEIDLPNSSYLNSYKVYLIEDEGLDNI